MLLLMKERQKLKPNLNNFFNALLFPISRKGETREKLMINGFKIDEEILRPTFCGKPRNFTELDHQCITGVGGYDMKLTQHNKTKQKYMFTVGNTFGESWWGQEITENEYQKLLSGEMTPTDLLV